MLWCNFWKCNQKNTVYKKSSVHKMLLPLLILQNICSKLRMKGLTFLWLISTNSLNAYNKLMTTQIINNSNFTLLNNKQNYYTIVSNNPTIMACLSFFFVNHYSYNLLLCIKSLHCKIVSKYFIRIKLECTTSSVLQILTLF